jgi:hypothetical protein
MAFPTDTFTASDLAELIPEVWGERINDIFKKEVVFASFFTDRSSELRGGASALYTPNLTEMSANDKSNGAAVTLNSPTETKVTLTVNTWKEVSFAIEDLEAAQVKQSYNIQRMYAENAGYTVAMALETAIAALFSGFSQSVGASTTNIQDSDIRAAISTLEAAAVPGVRTGSVAFFLHPNTFWRQVQATDRFALAVNSPVNDPTARIPDSHLYGIPVYLSPNVPTISGGTTGRYNLLAHKDAIHFATAPLGAMSKGAMVGSAGIRVQSNYMPDYLSTVTTADIAFGVVENRDTAGVRILTHATAV